MIQRNFTLSIIISEHRQILVDILHFTGECVIFQLISMCAGLVNGTGTKKFDGKNIASHNAKM